MKVLILGHPISAHVIKWANSLDSKGIEIIVAGTSSYDKGQYNKNITVISFNFPDKYLRKSFGSIPKLAYLKIIPQLKKIVRDHKPDIIHSHIASSYGLIGALLNFHPYVVSVWGFDVFEFPLKSYIHRKTLEWVLKKADKVLSTSHFMAKEIQKYTKKPIAVTPFGIDTEIFKPIGKKENKGLLLGTIKGLEPVYGIETLVKAFKVISDRNPDENLRLLIVGGGSLYNEIKKLISDLGLDGKVELKGQVPYNEVPQYHNQLDIFIAVSTLSSESFGVAIVEAEACGTPVIVSNIGGLPEVILNGETGIIVPPNNVEETALAMEKLIHDTDLRIKMGKRGREFVCSTYKLEDNIQQMIDIYKTVV